MSKITSTKIQITQPNMTKHPSRRSKGHRWEVVVETLRFSIFDLLKFTVVVALAITVGRLIQSFIPLYSANIFFCVVCGYFIYWHLIKRFVFSLFIVSRRYSGNSIGTGALVGHQSPSKRSSRIGLYVIASSMVAFSIVLVPLRTIATQLPHVVFLLNSAVMLFNAAYGSACLERKGKIPEDVEFFENGVCIGFIFFPWTDINVQASDWVHPGVVIQKRVKAVKAKPNPFVAKVSPELLEEVLRITNQSQPQSLVVE